MFYQIKRLGFEIKLEKYAVILNVQRDFVMTGN